MGKTVNPSRLHVRDGATQTSPGSAALSGCASGLERIFFWPMLLEQLPQIPGGSHGSQSAEFTALIPAIKELLDLREWGSHVRPPLGYFLACSLASFQGVLFYLNPTQSEAFLTEQPFKQWGRQAGCLPEC